MGSLLAAFGVVFVAELGDKTQLVALGFGARHRLAPVLVGVVVAYALSTLLSVVVGGLLGATLPTRAIALGGGVLFLGFAAWSLRAPRDDADDHAAPPSEEPDLTAAAGERELHVVVSVATAMFVAELGDKTMLATATLAAQGNPVLTWFGATAGIICAGALGVFAGRMFGARLSERATRIGSSVLFAGFGIALIATNL